ncbi:hypothetical protein ACFFNY_14755 [Paenibacillus hodogayensis]|uniref:Uncharacterized protein n=1 Tax=Paenibacillus hodogayensis TaxID=279208 RepID=A0ABV5VX13_9BACL
MFLLGLCLAAVAAESEPLAGVVLTFTSTFSISASFQLNISGIKRNMANNRVMMVVIGIFFTIINTFAYIYSLIVGLAKVSLYSNGLALLLFIFAILIPAALAFITAIRGGMPSTKDKIKIKR